MRIKFTARLAKKIAEKVSESMLNGDRRGYNRSKALELLGKGMSPREIAGILQISCETIRRYVCGFVGEGLRFLTPRRSNGRPSKLSKDQRKQLKTALRASPSKYGFYGGIWTSAMVAELIHTKFGVLYSVAYLPKLLKNMGFSWQKSTCKNYRQDAARLADWKVNLWPKLLRRAKKKRAKIFFEDECSFSLSTTQGYSWAPRGQQPICETTGSKANVKVYGAIEYFSGRLMAYTTKDQLNGQSYTAFLKYALKHTRGKLIWIHDGAGYHRSKDVKKFLGSTDRIELVLLPPYCPELNPIEKLWKKFKQTGTHNKFFKNIESLTSQVEKMIEFFGVNSHLVSSLMPKWA